MDKPIRIGTRGSRLALAQADAIQRDLSSLHPERSFERTIIKTTGDRILDAPLAKIGSKGLFTKEVEHALLDGTIDLAVHSMKDVPTQLMEGTRIGAVPKRLSPADVLVARKDSTIHSLNDCKTIATSSLRRTAQLRRLRPDIIVRDIRGNLDTRLGKLDDSGELDGLLLARAGLERLGHLSRIADELTPEQMIPAVGQGALAIQIREADEATAALLAPLHHPSTDLAVRAERTLLAALEGGCQVPIGATATTDSGNLQITACVCSLDGSRLLKAERTGSADHPETLGQTLAEELLKQGAGKIIEEVRKGIL